MMLEMSSARFGPSMAMFNVEGAPSLLFGCSGLVVIIVGAERKRLQDSTLAVAVAEGPSRD